VRNDNSDKELFGSMRGVIYSASSANIRFSSVGTFHVNLLHVALVGYRYSQHVTITILDIIDRLVFYLKLNSTLSVCLYLTGNTLRLRYEPNRLMLATGL
jgi:hypothetical protein